MSDREEDHVEKAKEFASAAEQSASAAESAKNEALNAASFVTNFIDAVKSSQPGNINPAQPKLTRGKHLDEYLEDYYSYSGKTSDINRNLALAGVAIIWLFRNTEPGPLFNQDLLTSLILLIISLSLDLLHYLFATVFWGVFYMLKSKKWRNKKMSDAQALDLEAPDWKRIFLTVIFGLKIFCMVGAYVYLLFFLQGKMKPAKIENIKTANDSILILHNVYFDFGQFMLRKESFVSLDSAIVLLNKKPYREVEICAYTDDRGSDSYNILLSQKRANAVREYLLSRKVLSKKIITTGYGEMNPIASNKNEADRQRNRRVEFRFMN